MKVVFSIMLGVALWFAVAGGCKKPGNNNITGGGKGGNGTISVTPEHHGQLLDSVTVYIKYGTLDAPADGKYDDSILPLLPMNGPLATDTIPVANFYHLKTGLYYFYCVGIHPGFSPPYAKGGRSYTLAKEDSENVSVPTYSYNP